MTVYYKLDHSEPGYLSQMLPRADGSWVKRADYEADLAAARAEIERLKVKLQARDGECKGKAEIIAQLEAERDEARDEIKRLTIAASSWEHAARQLEFERNHAKAALEAYGREKVRDGMKRIIDRLRHEGQINPSLTYADAIEWAEYVLNEMEKDADQ